MKLDQRLIAELTAMSDDELWRTIRTMAGGKGIRLPEATPPHETLEQLRGAVRGNGTLRLGEAVAVISRYLKEGGAGK